MNNSNLNSTQYISIVVIFEKNVSTQIFFSKIHEYRKKNIFHYMHLKCNNGLQYYICKMQKKSYCNFYKELDKNLTCITLDSNQKTQQYYNNCTKNQADKFINSKKCKFITKKYIPEKNQLILTTNYDIFYHDLIIEKMFKDCDEIFIEENCSKTFSTLEYLTNNDNTNNDNTNNDNTNNDNTNNDNANNNNTNNDNTNNDNTNNDIFSNLITPSFEDTFYETIENLELKIADDISNVKSEIFSSVISNISHMITLQVKLEFQKYKMDIQKYKINNNNDNDNNNDNNNNVNISHL